MFLSSKPYAFSSVEEDQRSAIVERCYWPLLRLAKKHSLPFGIEASVCTLELIQQIDPNWIAELRHLIHHGSCEFIGSGYAQLIGPLVPFEVNRANLQLGMDSYESILGVRPSIALVNEQAYSAGLVPLYSEAGYRALIMEWNNASRSHRDWPSEFCYYPQKATGLLDSDITLIWNQSIAFQKFQRYVHGAISIDQMLSYLYRHTTNETRCFPLYGNDAEIFGFRPGRFMTEAPLQDGEWDRIEALVLMLSNNSKFSWAAPSSILNFNSSAHSHNTLTLESINQPIPVKKQDKYNITRWALTGRDDLSINSTCHRIFQSLSSNILSSSSDWKELCYLWSSDFRTHITKKRWNNYIKRLGLFEAKWVNPPHKSLDKDHAALTESTNLYYSRDGHLINVSTQNLNIIFNARRGLAVESFLDKRFASSPMFGTIHHGHFDDISWGADYYSGNIVFQSPGKHQITDLMLTQPDIYQNGSILTLRADIPTPLGPITKTWSVDAFANTLTLHIQLSWPEAGLGRLRIYPFIFSQKPFHRTT